jgi:hypothetical protein
MNRDDLLSLLPEWFKRVIEYPEIMAAYAKALSSLDGNIEQLWKNQYLQTCDEPTLALYEKLLKITPSGTDSVEYRREIALNKYSMIVPFSEDFLRDRLDVIFGAGGYELVIDSPNQTAELSVIRTVPRGLSIFFDLWYGIAPAQMEVTAKEDITSDTEGFRVIAGAVESGVSTDISQNVWKSIIRNRRYYAGVIKSDVSVHI